MATRTLRRTPRYGADCVKVSFVGARKKQPVYVTAIEALTLYVAGRIRHARDIGFFTASQSGREIETFVRDLRGQR